jgi:hypothetical protein
VGEEAELYGIINAWQRKVEWRLSTFEDRVLVDSD